MVNDTTVFVYNLTSKNFTYNPCPEQNEGSCFNYSKKAEQNAFSYSSTNQILPNITSYMKINESPPPTGILFDINFSAYTPDPNYAGPYRDYRGVGGPNGTIFNLSSYLKIDSLRTAFDSIYFNVYILPAFRYTNPGYLYDTIYYSITRGIVKIIDSNNNKFELIKAE
jgi:hypothetical protein